MNFFNKVSKQIEAIKNFVEAQKEVEVGVDYRKVRSEFNVLVVGALIGCAFKKTDEGRWVTSGWNRLPDKNEFIEIMMLADDFITNVEPRLIQSHIEEGMELKHPLGRNVKNVEKINNQVFRDILMDAMNKPLCKEDFTLLANLAERLRKRNMKIAGFWAIGITVFVAVGAAAYVYNKRQEAKAAGAQNPDPIENYDDVGSDVVITVDDDTPVVIVTDDASDVTVID